MTRRVAGGTEVQEKRIVFPLQTARPRGLPSSNLGEQRLRGYTVCHQAPSLVADIRAWWQTVWPRRHCSTLEKLPKRTTGRYRNVRAHAAMTAVVVFRSSSPSAPGSSSLGSRCATTGADAADSGAAFFLQHIHR